MREDEFVLLDENQKEIKCQILFTCKLEGYPHSYVIFKLLDDDEISAARYVEKSEGEGELFDIEEDAEWDQLDKILDQYFSDIEEAENEK